MLFVTKQWDVGEVAACLCVWHFPCCLSLLQCLAAGAEATEGAQQRAAVLHPAHPPTQETDFTSDRAVPWGRVVSRHFFSPLHHHGNAGLSSWLAAKCCWGQRRLIGFDFGGARNGTDNYNNWGNFVYDSGWFYYSRLPPVVFIIQLALLIWRERRTGDQKLIKAASPRVSPCPWVTLSLSFVSIAAFLW